MSHTNHLDTLTVHVYYESVNQHTHTHIKKDTHMATLILRDTALRRPDTMRVTWRTPVPKIRKWFDATPGFDAENGLACEWAWRTRWAALGNRDALRVMRDAGFIA
nr:MAG TPA: hypothetical protein [Caudoviricetes sp.]